MTRAVAYLRVSSIKDKNRAISPEQQEAAVRALAVQHDDNLRDEDILKDWSRSGGKRLRDRGSGSRELVRRVEAGEVKAIYCYASSRLGRNLAEALHLIDLADAHGVERMWSYSDGDLNPKTASGKFTRNVLAAAAQFQRDESVERGQANYEHRVERGDRIGVARYGETIDKETHKAVPNPREDVSAVLEAYRRSGRNFSAAAVLLTSDPKLSKRARPRRAKSWSPTSLARVVRRLEKVPERGHVWTPPKLVKDYALYKLIVCPHDHYDRKGKRVENRLTAQRSTSGNGTRHVRYVCRSGVHDPEHPRPYAVAESFVLPWIDARLRAEGYDRMETRRQTIGGGPTRADLEEDRRRVGVSYRLKTMTDDEATDEIARIDAALESLPEDAEDDAGGITLTFTTPLDLTADPAFVNQKLRRAIDRIELNDAMRPKRVIWK